MSMSILLAHNMLKKGDLPEPLWSGSMLQYSIQRSCDVTMCILGLYITVEAGWMQHRSVPQDLKEEKQSMFLGINMLNTHLLNQEIGTHWRKKCSYLCRSTERNTISHNSHISMRNKWLRNYRGGGEESKRDYKYNSHTVFWKHLSLCPVSMEWLKSRSDTTPCSEGTHSLCKAPLHCSASGFCSVTPLLPGSLQSEVIGMDQPTWLLTTLPRILCELKWVIALKKSTAQCSRFLPVSALASLSLKWSAYTSGTVPSCIVQDNKPAFSLSGQESYLHALAKTS